jgi:glucose-fructose oxidoreductase
VYFSNCILRNEEPEPSGKEGLIDVRIIEALQQSVKSGRPVTLEIPSRKRRPTRRQEIVRPGLNKPRLVHAKSPSGS